ncbi:hypothetical protein HYH03_002323 [Edaphochlamys debaryana]|uniref:Uncharacterized protein n=1 Tax=Edaphochlamys debaryana TaxID=47281 RepID=A0A835YCA1_9CHLO|nr:hypothetical protein HYH03_002323 [Edaphochlamys debaryana]|eukprot:KAG2500043.1 hypothetical protein HYH03_002323 [Edaphochlamys debaryana]
MASFVVGTNKLGIDANNLYTRGTAGQTENVGKSMVQLHAEQMQLDKEQNALQKLSILMPQLGFFARVMALRETDWDVEKALPLLRRFVAENDLKLKAIQKKRKKVQAELEKAAEGSSDSGSGSSSGSESEGGSGSDSEGGGRGKRKRSGKDKDKKRSKKKRGKEKEKKKRSKDKDKAVMGGGGAMDFGKYGIIREADGYAKRNEFILWALDVKKVDVENLGKFEERDLFKDYMEDYNTGTLPHRKYYDLEAYERAKAAKAAAKGAKAAAKGGKKAVNDEEALRQEREEERRKLAAERMQDAYRQIKYSDKAQAMRDQEMLRAKMNLAYKTGDLAEAQRLHARLEPDDPTKVKK